eukprot:1155008-Pelagomonas_calceolata.AAC.3
MLVGGRCIAEGVRSELWHQGCSRGQKKGGDKSRQGRHEEALDSRGQVVHGWSIGGRPSRHCWPMLADTGSTA